MALPFAVVALALALNAVLRGCSRNAVVGRRDWLGLLFSGAAVGALYAMNSWDYPTYLLLVSGAVWIGFRAAGPRRAGLAVLVLVASSVTAWAPFIAGFVPPTGGSVANLPAVLRGLPVLPGLLTTIALHTGERTSIGEFLTIFGVPYALALWLIGSGLIVEHARQPLRLSRTALAGFLLALAVAILLPVPLLAVCGLPLAGAVVLLGRQPSLSPRTAALGLFTLGFALVLGVEFVYIRDVFNNRMNTLFKIYYQVWTLFAIGAALATVVIWAEARPRRLARPALAVSMLLALLSSAVYPALASYRWTGEFQEWQGLDGIAYVGQDDPGELAAIRWLQTHATADDVMLEAPGCSYQPISQFPFDRASAFTGVPTIIGWDNHERQWRSGEPSLLNAIVQRQEDARKIFADPNGDLVRNYGITLLYVGRYEREAFDCPVAGPYRAVLSPTYPGAGWTLAFEQGDVRIFRRSAPPATDVAPASETPRA
jgi:YYY domain-containing protein